MFKLPINIFNNDLYSITGVNAKNVSISYIDLQYTTSTTCTTLQSGNNYPITVSPNVFSKSIQLDYVDISFKHYTINNEIEDMKILLDNLKNEINKSYFKQLTNLGEKHRITAPMNSFDINISDIKLKYNSKDKNISQNVSRDIISKLMMSSNYIATICRFGPAQWIISNTNTYRYILENIDSANLTFNNNNMLFGNMPYIVDDLIDDDIILIGRKNDSTTPGLHCFILTDENKNIYFEKFSDVSNYQRTYRFYYKIDLIGTTPEYNFLKLNTRTISYYRAKKLKRIKEVYGI